MHYTCVFNVYLKFDFFMGVINNIIVVKHNRLHDTQSPEPQPSFLTV